MTTKNLATNHPENEPPRLPKGFFEIPSDALHDDPELASPEPTRLIELLAKLALGGEKS